MYHKNKLIKFEVALNQNAKQSIKKFVIIIRFKSIILSERRKNIYLKKIFT